MLLNIVLLKSENYIYLHIILSLLVFIYLVYYLLSTIVKLILSITKKLVDNILKNKKMEQKIKEFNGHRYTINKSFDGYKFSYTIKFKLPDDEYYSKIEVYTTNSNKFDVLNYIECRLVELFQAYNVELLSYSTYEQDVQRTKMIEEFLLGV